MFPSVHDIDLDVYVRPEENGRILAGDGTERVEADPDRFSTGGDEQFVTHLAESFGSRFPGWADAELVRAWAGVCVATPDRRPLIGPVPGASGLYTITGFNGFGVMRAGGAAARLAAVLAVGDGSERELEKIRTVLPGRFTGPFAAFPIKPGFTLEGGDDPRF
jgi:glycine/D-amino acid oxidase-like deaminating enzyme